MQFKDAETLLPRFTYLTGWVSESFQSSIENVLVSFQDPILAKSQYRAFKQNVGFPHRPDDAGRYTIVAALQNGKIVPLNSIIELDKIEALYDDAKTLEGMFVEA